jgi:SAM-dependent methyltransferase
MDRLAPPPRPPPQRRAFSTFGGPVDVGGHPEEARALAALFEVDPALARAFTHGFHTYAGRMHPTIARGAVARWSAPGDVVLDPFCGSGTALVEAMAAGRRARGIDASPLAVAIATTRSQLLGAATRDRLLAEARRIAGEAGERARKRRRPVIPDWGKREMREFHPHVALELYGLRELVMETREDEVGRALRMCLSSILVKFMRAGREAPRDGENKRIARGIPSRFLADRAEELCRALAEVEGVTPAGTPAPVIGLGDARGYPDVPAASVRLILSSPPYAGTYDYAGQHEVRFRWLDLPRRRFRERQIGERDEGPGTAARAWAEARQAWLGEMGRVLAPGGHAVLVVGDGVVGDRAEDAATEIARAAPAAGLVPVARASQARPPRDRRLADVFNGRERREHILLLGSARSTAGADRPRPSRRPSRSR